MQEGWDKPLWIFRKLKKNSEDNMKVLTNKLDAIQNIFKTAGSATAEGKDILYGKTAYNGSTLLTGSMPNMGQQNKTLNCGGAYTIPEGYHDGTGIVSANSLASQTQVDADKTAVTAATMLEGSQAWVNGNKISGSMPNKQGTTVTTSVVTKDDYYTYLNIPSRGCYDSNSKVRILSNSLYFPLFSIKPVATITFISGNYASNINLELQDESGNVLATKKASGSYQTDVSATLETTINGHTVKVVAKAYWEGSLQSLTVYVDGIKIKADNKVLLDFHNGSNNELFLSLK